MAKVFMPLYSLSASGRLGNNLTFQRTAFERGKTITRTIRGETVVVRYPPRIIGGTGVVKSQVQKQPRKRLRLKGTTEAADPVQARQESIFMVANALARWLVARNVYLATSRVLPPRPGAAAWHARRYFLNADDAELHNFPGQEIGRAVRIRRNYARPLSRHGYIVRALINSRNNGFRTALGAWNNLEPIERTQWENFITNEMRELPETYNLERGVVVSRGFAHLWIQYSWRLTTGLLTPGWNRDWLTLGVFAGGVDFAPDDFRRLIWDLHLSPEARLREVNVPPWRRRNA